QFRWRDRFRPGDGGVDIPVAADADTLARQNDDGRGGYASDAGDQRGFRIDGSPGEVEVENAFEIGLSGDIRGRQQLVQSGGEADGAVGANGVEQLSHSTGIAS